MKNITLCQDAANKLEITLPESKIIAKARLFFKWRKDVTISRINKLGTSQRDKFIASLTIN